MKWPNVTSRLIIPDADDQLDTAVMPDSEEENTSEEDTEHLERQVLRPRNRPTASNDPTELDDHGEEGAISGHIARRGIRHWFRTNSPGWISSIKEC